MHKTKTQGNEIAKTEELGKGSSALDRTLT